MKVILSKAKDLLLPWFHTAKIKAKQILRFAQDDTYVLTQVLRFAQDDTYVLTQVLRLAQDDTYV